MYFRQSITASLIASVFFVSGCESVSHKNLPTIEGVTDTVTQAQAKFPTAEASSNLHNVRIVRESYISRRKVPLALDASLPPVFARPQDFSVSIVDLSGRMDLNELAAKITDRTHIEVRIDDSVYDKSAKETTSPAATSLAAPQAGSPFPPPSPGLSLPGQSQQQNNDSKPGAGLQGVKIQLSGPLANSLTRVAQLLNISWEYRNGAIVFYRYKVKTFELRGLNIPNTIKTTYQTGTSGGGSSGTSSSSNNSGSQNYGLSVANEAKWEPTKALMETLAAVKTAGGRITINDMANSITAYDTPLALDRFTQIIEDYNRRSGRSMYFKIEVLSITSRENKGLRAELSPIFTHGKFRWIGQTVPQISDKIVGGVGGFVLPAAGATVPTLGSPGSAGDAMSRFDGSSGVLKAISEVADVASTSTLDVYTKNNKSVTAVMTTNKDYVQNIGSTSTQVAVSTQVQQNTINYGLNLFLLPRIQDNNVITLYLNIDMSDFGGFDVTTFTGGSVKSPTTPRRFTEQTFTLRPGETIWVTGLDQASRSSNANIGMGGGVFKDGDKHSTVVQITPVLLED